MKSEDKYSAFLCYSHRDNHSSNRRWAAWLHQMLERYEVPHHLVGTMDGRGYPIPKSLFPIFTDEAELPADSDLRSSIISALDQSRFLVVLCSPNSTQSMFVNEEIRYFKETGRSDRILAVILSGTPNADFHEGGAAEECFPEALRFGTPRQDGSIDWTSRTEPIAADFRLPDSTEGFTNSSAYREALKGEGLSSSEIKVRIEQYDERRQLGVLKLIAGILGIPLGQLVSRDRSYTGSHWGRGILTPIMSLLKRLTALPEPATPAYRPSLAEVVAQPDRDIIAGPIDSQTNDAPDENGTARLAPKSDVALGSERSGTDEFGKKTNQPANSITLSPWLDELVFDELEVFISAKSEDSVYALEVFAFLERNGKKVFYSEVSLPEAGSDDFFLVIEDALDAARHLVVVTSSKHNVRSPWVRHEWKMFQGEKLAGRKRGNLIPVLAGAMRLEELPLSLRQRQVFHLAKGLDALLRFLK